MFVELLKLTGNYIIICMGDLIIRGKMIRMSSDERSIVLEDVKPSTSKSTSSDYYNMLSSSFNLFSQKGINIPELVVSTKDISAFFLDGNQDHIVPLKSIPKIKKSNPYLDEPIQLQVNGGNLQGIQFGDLQGNWAVQHEEPEEGIANIAIQGVGEI